MKTIITLAVTAFILASCNTTPKDQLPAKIPAPIAGTWQLISGTTIEKDDTVVTYYTNNMTFIKIINDTHFAFLKHDVKKGKDSSAVFVAGGGRYSLADSLYTEHLEYCSDRQWEGNEFPFNAIIKNDTLIQTGREKVDNAGIDRLNIEIYARVKS